jgi:hypothetical protein
MFTYYGTVTYSDTYFVYFSQNVVSVVTIGLSTKKKKVAASVIILSLLATKKRKNGLNGCGNGFSDEKN